MSEEINIFSYLTSTWGKVSFDGNNKDKSVGCRTIGKRHNPFFELLWFLKFYNTNYVVLTMLCDKGNIFSSNSSIYMVFKIYKQNVSFWCINFSEKIMNIENFIHVM